MKSILVLGKFAMFLCCAVVAFIGALDMIGVGEIWVAGSKRYVLDVILIYVGVYGCVSIER